MHQYKELKVWQKAMSITKLTYRLCAGFPDNERFGLVSQMRRAAVSMPSNIAEGAGRNSRLEFRQFLAIANGSAYELETQLLLANSFGYNGFVNGVPGLTAFRRRTGRRWLPINTSDLQRPVGRRKKPSDRSECNRYTVRETAIYLGRKSQYYFHRTH
ncbi:four helix bundle protein [Hymenobacter algoricola]|uniref:four helix bundle protein n=1 Tax=Hymenobacter algoricola TaxID=486267 RepID=UPI0031F1036C